MANPILSFIDLVDGGLSEESDEHESEEEEDESEEEEDEEEEGTVDADSAVYHADLTGAAGSAPETAAARNGDEEVGNKRRRSGGSEAVSVDGVGSAECSQGSSSQWNRNEMDGLFCSICLEPWTNDGDHHISCLPCGHLFGMSCIKRWLQQRSNSGKCPQCNKKCALKDVRKLFVSQIVSVDEESQKRIRSLEAKCDSLEKKESAWCKREVQWRKRELELQDKVQHLTERAAYLEHLLGDTQNGTSGVVNANGVREGRFVAGEKILDERSYGRNFGSKFCGQAYSCNFILEKELQVDGARLFDVDESNQIILISRRLDGIGGRHVLTKMSLIPPYDRDDILLPRDTRAIRDLRISSSNSDLALFACLGKKLSVLSMESNNVILTYDLPAAAWTCSWDLNNPYYAYAGLQNGSLWVFDMRRTAGPVESRRGLSNNPIHTVHSLSHNSALPSGARSVLSASSIGLCLWNFGCAEEGPTLVPQTENQGVCISLAYCPSNDDIVASYRPKVEMPDETLLSQPQLTPTRGGFGQGTVGSHVLLKRADINCVDRLGSACTNVCDIGLPKSAIINVGNHRTLFASQDKLSSELVLQELPSFTTLQRLKLQKDPLRDLKYSPAIKQGLLSCLSGDKLQLFSTKLSGKR
ncbi:E3 ubiquitin-protein ligase RFWD3 isoform X3 [Pyrus x bretschneideri]|uniref:E3 ubiquitin-protein ligase RFWD3 isoform X3 n=1 Tax=Pyrus x bretschneideri TaxID=225117 RepID=UPI00202DF415|nr:E3 ubiquitin-protein ligase RFWD3 isoform X3 [Pyrus x bretschneideri]